MDQNFETLTKAFNDFKKAFCPHLDKLQGELFSTSVLADDVWDKYLDSFPKGWNPIFRVRRHFDGSYDRQVVKKFGGLVQIKNDKVVSIWRTKKPLPFPFNEVAETLADFVESHEIKGIFRANEPHFGHEPNVEILDDNTTIRWTHLLVKTPSQVFLTKNGSVTPEKAIGDRNNAIQGFKNSLNRISLSAAQTVKSLIEDNLLYRGEENLSIVNSFIELKRKYDDLKPKKKEIFIWTIDRPFNFRSSAIGTLMEDLSDGVDMERAVSSFEAKVAPTNYRRSKALITQGMIDSALKEIDALGLEDAIERREANIRDVNVKDILWVDRAARDLMKGKLATILEGSAKKKAAPAKSVTDISIEDFIKDVLPTASKVEVWLENDLTSNLMTLTAPAIENAPSLFKWQNGFGWSYNGNVTDSIKEKVKKAGGKSDARFRVSLAWWNHDDLDLHCRLPSGDEIYFGNKKNILDVDMNAGGNLSTSPVENLSWDRLPDGEYKVYVNQFRMRTRDDVGFELEASFDGEVYNWTYAPHLSSKLHCLTFEVVGGKVVEVTPYKKLVSNSASKEVWGIQTNDYVPVETVMLSPNFWNGEKIGNRHWFFILKGCKNPEPVRGFYNEFLDPKLDKHRKVFEVLAGKMKCEPADDQLSGVGFSSTVSKTVQVRIKSASATARVYNVKVGN